jgi:hypothetical protein
MVGQYLPKKPKFTFCYNVLKRQIFLTTKRGQHAGVFCWIKLYIVHTPYEHIPMQSSTRMPTWMMQTRGQWPPTTHVNLTFDLIVGRLVAEWKFWSDTSGCVPVDFQMSPSN